MVTVMRMVMKKSNNITITITRIITIITIMTTIDPQYSGVRGPLLHFFSFLTEGCSGRWQGLSWVLEIVLLEVKITCLMNIMVTVATVHCITLRQV